jgi:hypothetical protein
MKKTTISILVLFFGIVFTSFSQDKPADFFAGKWEISIAGTPNGDIKFTTELIRKDGKLTGELKDPTGTMKEVIPISNVEEEADLVRIFFTAQGYDVNVELKKEDDNNLKGSLLGMFESKAVRIK